MEGLSAWMAVAWRHHAVANWPSPGNAASAKLDDSESGRGWLAEPAAHRTINHGPIDVDCSVVGDFSVNGRNVDDVRFLSALADKLIAEIGLDRSRVFATGVSAGGFMSMRLALEAPSRFRAVAAVSANVPAPENFKCHPAGQGTAVLIMNGTKDPLVPFGGGEVNLLGLFYKGGNVLSSRESGQYFADLDKIAGIPKASHTIVDGVSIEQLLWRDDTNLEVELVAIQGGGHGLPQATWRRPRLLGPSPMAPDGPALIWAFFERQRQ